MPIVKQHFTRKTTAPTAATSATAVFITAAISLSHDLQSQRRSEIILDRLIITANTAGAIHLEVSSAAILPTIYVPATTTVQIGDLDIRIEQGKDINIIASGSACTIMAHYFVPGE